METRTREKRYSVNELHKGIIVLVNIDVSIVVVSVSASCLSI